MKNLSSAVFVFVLAVIVFLGFIDSAQALSQLEPCTIQCFDGGVCFADPGIDCQLYINCGSTRNYPSNCYVFFYEMCCDDGCPC